MKYGDLTRGQTKAFINKAGGEAAVRLVLAGKAIIKVVMAFPTWRTLKLLVYASVDKLRDAITQSGAEISPWADQLLNSQDFKLTQQEEEIDLVVVSNADLGRPNGCKLQETIHLAAEQGLDPCPIDTGPQLRERYRDQPKGEWLTVVTEPIAGSAGSPDLFGVHRGDDGRWLGGDGGRASFFWVGDFRFVFRRRK